MRNYIQRVSAGLLLIICMLAGCGDVDGPGAAVESVKVTGAPVGPVLSGASLQLAATTLDASGDAVTGRPVSWRSSDSTVAVVSPQGLVSATGVGTATITASAEGKEGTASLDVRAGARLGREGGTLNLFGGAVTVVALPDPLVDTVTMMVRPVAAPLPDPRLVPGTVFELSPERIPFRRAQLTLKYDPASLPPGISEAGLQLHRFIGGVWFLHPSSRDGRSITGHIGTGGVYAVMSPRVGRVALGGPLHAGAAMYAGQNGQLTATLLNAYGDTLRDRTAGWSSSDPTRATVDGSGRVTALSAGEVTITATSDEKSAEVVLTIFARAVADWSRASEWTTTQGNARHSGHVAATLDPSTFRELWVAGLADDRALTPVVAGDGKVFVATAHYAAPDRLLALDARNGATVWSRDFGGVETVSQPAYGDGRVYVMTSDGNGGNGGLWSLDARDGAVRFRAFYASGGAPVVADGGVYTADSRSLYRFDAITGAQTFRVESMRADWLPAVANGLVYAFDGNGLAALHSRSGAVAFRIPDPRFDSWNAPVLDAYGNLVAVGQRRLFLLGLQSRQVGWEWPGDFSYGSPTVADRVVYALHGDYLEARETGRGALVWAWKPPEGRPGGATVATDNILFVAVRSVADRWTTYALDARTGKQVWSYPAAGHMALSSQGILFIAQGNGKLAAISVR